MKKAAYILLFIITISCSQEEAVYCWRISKSMIIRKTGEYINLKSETICDKTEDEIKSICDEIKNKTNKDYIYITGYSKILE